MKEYFSFIFLNPIKNSSRKIKKAGIIYLPPGAWPCSAPSKSDRKKVKKVKKIILYIVSFFLNP